MNFRVLFGLSTLFLLIQLAFCSYEPWEDIKRWYSDIEYDKEAADARHVEMERNCSDIHGEDGICFDECMFRTHYQIIAIPADKSSYYVSEENLLQNVGKNVMEVNQLTDSYSQMRQKRKYSFRSCMDYYISLKDILDVGPKLCEELMNGTYKDDMITIINWTTLKRSKPVHSSFQI